jgi:pyruvate,orthophosphate dikinase
VQDIEFTVQEGKLFMLQTRNGKRTAAAALKFSADMVKEKFIDWETAVLRNPADQLDQLLAPIFDLAEVKKAKVIATGLPAGPGAATGKIYLQRRPRRAPPPRRAKKFCSSASKPRPKICAA